MEACFRHKYLNRQCDFTNWLSKLYIITKWHAIYTGSTCQIDCNEMTAHFRGDTLQQCVQITVLR